MQWVSATIDPVEGLALAMLGFVALAMTTLVVLFLCMRHQVSRRDPHVDALLEELENDEREAARLARTQPATPPSQPWERDADWWKEP